MKFKSYLLLLLLLLPALCQAQRLKYTTQRLNAGSGNTAATALNAYYTNCLNIENGGYLTAINAVDFTQFSLDPNFSFIKQLSRGGSACIIKTDSNFRPYKVTEAMRAINLSQGDMLSTNGCFDKQKNVYFQGEFSGKIDIASGTEIKIVQATYPYPKRDGILAKYDSAANLKWHRQMNALSDSGSAGYSLLKVKDNGNLVLLVGGDRGVKMDSIVLAPDTRQYTQLTLELDSSGQVLDYDTMVDLKHNGFSYFVEGVAEISSHGYSYTSYGFAQVVAPNGQGIDIDPGPGVDSIFAPFGPNGHTIAHGIIKYDANFNYVSSLHMPVFEYGVGGMSSMIDGKYLLMGAMFCDSLDLDPDPVGQFMVYGNPYGGVLTPNWSVAQWVLDTNFNYVAGSGISFSFPNTKVLFPQQDFNFYDDQVGYRTFNFLVDSVGTIVLKTDTNMRVVSHTLFPVKYPYLRQNQKGELTTMSGNDALQISLPTDLDCFTTGVAMVAPFGGLWSSPVTHFIAIYDSTSYNNNPGVSTHAPLVGGTSIYPTPATHELVVERSAGSPPAAATLYDLWGRVVLATTLTQPRSQIGVGELPNGLYLLRIAGEGRSYKVVVQR